MTKRLCKFNRRDIAEELGTIHQVVVQPKFLCRSCSRVANDEARLCKPAELPNHKTLMTIAEPTPVAAATPQPKVVELKQPQENVEATSKKAHKKQIKQLKKIKKALKKHKKLAKKLAKVEKRSQVLQQELLNHPLELAEQPNRALH